MRIGGREEMMESAIKHVASIRVGRGTWAVSKTRTWLDLITLCGLILEDAIHLPVVLPLLSHYSECFHGLLLAGLVFKGQKAQPAMVERQM